MAAAAVALKLVSAWFRWPEVSILTTSVGFVADSQFATLYDVQACGNQQGNKIAEIDVTVVMKMIKKAAPALCWPCEIDGQHSSAGLQDPTHFASTLLARFPAQVVKHDSGQHRVELTVGKRQHFNDAFLEGNFSTSFLGLRLRPGEHLWRCVDSSDTARLPDPSFCSDG